MSYLVNHNINNLSGGISKQPDEARFDNQVEDMINCVPTVANGLRRRNPLEFVANTTDSINSNIKTHTYDRGDALEKYIMTMTSTGLNIYNDSGVKQNYDGTSYNKIIPSWGVSGSINPDNFKFLTVGDTTFILDTTKVVRSLDLSVAQRNPESFAFYWISRSFDDGQGGGYTYKIIIDGYEKEINSPTSDGAINQFKAWIDEGGSYAIEETNPPVTGFYFPEKPYTAEVHNSILLIRKTNGNNFTFEYSDSWGNQASKSWRDNIRKLEDLPASIGDFSEADVGTIAITGTDKDNFTGYYLRWKDGKFWNETVNPADSLGIDYETMPVRVTRTASGNFNLDYIYTWEDRKKGDEDSSPTPSFVDNTISNIFFFKNRLGFTSQENVILSEVAKYYNFFSTTALDVLDSDVIDASVDSNTVAIIRDVNAIAGAITLWADNAQFVLSGGEILSPATTRISQSSSYDSTNSISPVAIDNEIMFFSIIGNYMEAKSFSPASLSADKSTAESLSSHIPSYLPSTLDNVCVANGTNTVFFRDYVNRGVVYCYKYHVKNNERIMSSWFKWEMDYDIKAMNVLDNRLFLFVDNDIIFTIDLSDREVTDSFIDYLNDSLIVGNKLYESSVILSKFNLQTKQGTRIIREPFYIKNIVSRVGGDIDFMIINKERNSTKIVTTKHKDRKIFVGGNTDKINVGFKSSYDNGFKIDSISVEGFVKTQSVNK